VGLSADQDRPVGSVGSAGLGTGLANLRERLQLIFSDQAQLRLSAIEPHGFCAEIQFPAERTSTEGDQGI